MRVAVLGAGVMGRNIARVFGASGTEVVVYSRTRRTLDDARAVLVAGGVKGVAYVGSVAEAAAAAELVIESVPESVALKQAVLAEAEEAAPVNAVIASNTSSLPLEQIALGLQRPGRFLGLHWINPAHLIPLVEVVATDATDPAVVAWSLALLQRLGKRPIAVPAIDGFVANRLQYALIREALALIQAGHVGPEQIDAVMTGCLGPRWAVIGPMRSTDLAGLETAVAVATQLYPTLATDTVPPSVLTALAEQGRLGVATGEGFYPYPPGSDAAGDRDRRLSAVLDALSREPE